MKPTEYDIRMELVKEAKALLKLIPEWQDEKRRQRESNWVTAYLLGAGLPYDEIMNIRDARQVAIAYKALKFCLLQRK